MNKNILIIYTGGTICTSIKNGKMSTDSAITYALPEFYKNSDSPYAGSVTFENGKNFGILSENMTADKWNKIICCMNNEVLPKISEYDGIIIAHGTDTLAFSTSLFSLLLKGICIPVFFVSSNYPLLDENGNSNPKANGICNFRASVECICKGIAPGVYAAYKNPKDQITYLHKGEELIQCNIYDDNFYSRGAIDIENADFSNITSADVSTNAENLLITRFKNRKLQNCILKITPYTGLDYRFFNLKEAKAVLHGTYHSGTVCTDGADNSSQNSPNSSSIIYLFEKCASKNIPFYLSPSQRSDDATVYESVTNIENYTSNGQKIHFCYGDTDELIYAKLIIAYSLGMSDTEMDSVLNPTT